MVPTFSDFFKAMYYENNYLPPCDLSENALDQHLFETENPQLAAIAQELISNAEVQEVLSEPLTYDLANAVPKKCKLLESHQFKILSSKPNLLSPTRERVPFYSVVEHNNLPGWVIKSGASRTPKDLVLIGPSNDLGEMASFTADESILRIYMANRISQVAQENNINVVVPKKKLVKYANVKSPSSPNTTYCVVSEKIGIRSPENTVAHIKTMSEGEQTTLAQQICCIVQKVGLVDASFDNIRLTFDNRLAFIDTEPAGLMTVKKPGLWNRIFPPKGASVEKCARIGLFILLNQYEPGLEAFQKEVQSRYKVLSTPKLSKWKIAASVASLGIVALINAIVALVTTIWTKRTFKKSQKIDTSLESKIQSNPANLQNLIDRYKKDQYSITQQLLALVEGVPFNPQFA